MNLLQIHKLKWYIKVILWLVYFTLYILVVRTINPTSPFILVFKDAFSDIFATIISYYLITAFIIPYFFRKNRWLIGSVLILLSAWVYTAIDYLPAITIFRHIPLGADPMSVKLKYTIDAGFLQYIKPINILQHLIYILGAMTIPMSYWLITAVSKEYSKAYTLQKEKLDMEMAFLKSQLNPHFILNTLNNIYSLVATQDADRALSVIEKLSDMLRHTLYNTSQKSVLLRDEIDFLYSYIELAKLRDEFVTVNIYNNIPKNSKSEIIPLITFPFVENAFKYVAKPADKREKSHIGISFIEEEGNIFQFRIKNDKRIDVVKLSNKSKGGIGIQNTKNRLNLHYSKNYILEIKDEKDSYEIFLKIKL